MLGIVGTGLIGSSVGLAAARAGLRTLGWDPVEATALTARRLGAIAHVASSAEALIADAETIVLAATLPAIAALLQRFPPAPHARLITDVASVKVPVAAAGAALAHFVAGHPLAGSERSGPEAASADLFFAKFW